MVSHNYVSRTSAPQSAAWNQGCCREAREKQSMQRESDDTTSCPAKAYLEQSVEFQKRIVSLRESRALLDQKQRVREERATRMSYQFKNILCQMKQAQEDAFVAQERNMRLMGSISRSQPQQGNMGDNDKVPNFQNAKSHPVVVQQDMLETDQKHSSNGSNCAGSSVKLAHKNVIKDTESPHLDTASDARLTCCHQIHTPTSSRYEVLPGEKDVPQARSRQPLPKAFLCDAMEELLVGQQPITEKPTGLDADGNTYSLLREGRRINRVVGPEDNSSRTEVVSGLYDLNQPRIKFEEDQGLHTLSNKEVNTDGDGVKKTSQLQRDESCPLISQDTAWDTSDCFANRAWNCEETRAETSVLSEQRNPVLKIEMNDFFPATCSVDAAAAEHVYEPEVDESNSLSCFDVSSKQVEEAFTNDNQPFSSVRADFVEQPGERMQHLRDLITSWSPDEKLMVLTTLKNTMLLWEDQPSQFGWWPESKILLSSIFAANDSQLKLFEYLEVKEDISRPLTCCGAVYELLKAYPPERLLPFKFITDFFGSNDWNNRLHDGLTFEHLEEYQEEHSHFWQMLIHHSISVKDLGLGTLREIASVLRDIFCPRDLLEDLSPEIAMNVHEYLLEFLIEEFKSHETGQSQSILDESDGNSIPLSYNCIIPVENGLDIKMRRPKFHRVEAAQVSVRDVVVSDGLDLSLLQYDFLDTARGYKSESSVRSRSSKRGIFSSLGSLVRSPFRLWRSRSMTKGTDMIDDGFVRLLSPKRSISIAR